MILNGILIHFTIPRQTIKSVSGRFVNIYGDEDPDSYEAGVLRQSIALKELELANLEYEKEDFTSSASHVRPSGQNVPRQSEQRVSKGSKQKAKPEKDKKRHHHSDRKSKRQSNDEM